MYGGKNGLENIINKPFFGHGDWRLQSINIKLCKKKIILI